MNHFGSVQAVIASLRNGDPADKRPLLEGIEAAKRFIVRIGVALNVWHPFQFDEPEPVPSDGEFLPLLDAIHSRCVRNGTLPAYPDPWERLRKAEFCRQASENPPLTSGAIFPILAFDQYAWRNAAIEADTFLNTLKDLPVSKPAANPPPDLPQTLPVMLSAADLARHLAGVYGAQVTADAVDAFLRRYRNNSPDCCVEMDNPRMNEPRTLYRTADVLPALLQKYSK